MKTATRTSTPYLVTTLTVLGVFSAITAVLIAWPALAHLGTKLF